MRILVWSQYFWPEVFKINQLVDALQKLQMDISVFTGKPNYPDGDIYPNYRFRKVQYETYCGAEVIRIPLIPRKKNSLLQLALNYLSFIVFGYFYAPILLGRKPLDVIFVYATSPLLQALPAIFIARLKRIPLVLWVQDLWPESLTSTGHVKNRVALGLVKCLVRFIYNRADIILVQSKAFMEPVQQFVKDKSKIYFYPNASEEHIKSIPRIEDQPLLESIQKKFAIVFTGNLGKVQSCEAILQAAEQLLENQDIHFFLIGSGSMHTWIQGEVNKKNLKNVSLPGALPYETMPGIYDRASALLITLKDEPSLSATIPSKLQGYLAAGKPIIAGLNGEAAKIVLEAQAGLVSPADDGHALANNILKLYTMSPEEREHFGIHGLSYFKQHFELHTLARKLVEHFKETIRI